MQTLLDPPFGHDAKTVITNIEDEIANLLKRGWTIRPSKPSLGDNEVAQWENGQWVIYQKSPPLNPYFDTLENGFLCQPEGFYLRLDDESRAMFGQMLILLNELLSSQLITLDTVHLIKDKDNGVHSVTTLRFKQIMIQYGMYFKYIWDEFNSAN